MADKQKCMIIGAVPIRYKSVFREYPPEDFYIICADAGYQTALRYGITPDLVVGDFDSATEPPPEHLQIMTLPVQKDVTDTMFAAMRGLEMGFTYFVLLGCLGGERFDHSYANLEVLQYITAHSAVGILADRHTKAVLLKNRRLKITDSKGFTVSVFPFYASSCNVTYKGLEYPLQRQTLVCGGTLMGVSNSVTEDYAEIIVHAGTALVIIYDPGKPVKKP